MTPAGTFVINGSERIIVSQLHRSPGVFFDQSMHANGAKLYSARIIPFKGSWIEFATDINNVMYAYIDRKKKLPVTTLLRAIGYNADKDIIDIFDLADEVNVNLEELRANKGRKLANNVIRTKFEDFIDEDTGEVTPVERNEIIVRRGEVLDDDTIDAILQSDEKTILLQKDENNSNEYAIISTTEIAIGSNLLIYSWIEDLVKLNKSFVVKRGMPVRQQMDASSTLSAYVRDRISCGHQNIWIAQREGRSKDGNDKTQGSVLKMLNLSGSNDLLTNFRVCHLSSFKANNNANFVAVFQKVC